jgi:putative colanic acid biosysnthesis UDP-glucose lipid carrier transferase
MSMFPPQNAAFRRPEKCTKTFELSRLGTRARRMNRISVRLSTDARAAELYAPRPQGPLGAAARSGVKRLCDVICSAMALIFLAPFLIFLAVLVKTTSSGPILFKQVRTGLGGVPFVILKFRTMTVEEHGVSVIQARRDDHRLTPIGAFLRSSSLDELPQFLNVLFGDMSIVGPRPHAIAHDMHYGGMIPTYCERFRVRPGITGLAQCNGARGPTETLDKMRRRIRLDLAYVERWSWAMEIKIIAKTIRVILGGDDTAF